ncbi:MAG: PAS domain S-box protein [Myxococcales bacterium]|nr:PAS domain S-box protein [Myxococcales bacterium]
MEKTEAGVTAQIRELEERVRRLEARRIALETEIATTRFSEQSFSSILDTVPDFVVKLSPDGIIHFANRIAPGLTRSQVIGASMYDFLAPEFVEVARECIERVVRSGTPGVYESVGVGPHGKAARYFTRVGPLTRGSEVESLVLVATDVTELLEAQARLSESREKLELAIAASGVGLWSWQLDSDTHAWDPTTLSLFGIGEAPGNTSALLELVHPDDRARLEACARMVRETGHYEDVEYRVVRPDGELRWLMCKGRAELDSAGRAVRLAGGMVDVTERHALQEQLLQAQKMEAVGQLAAGIAHNFNNMLTVMLSSMELAAEKSGDEVASVLESGRHSAQMAAKIVRQLMVFSAKPRHASREVEDLASIVQRTVEMSRTTFGHEVAITVSLASDLPPVRCDAGQIEQALLNVLINARDAFDGRESGSAEIRVSVDRVRGAGESGSEARIKIEDNGCGMPDEVQRRAFEPFFTTKELGRGTGLGLATTYAILREHGGRVACRSTEGVGTRIELFLPSQSATEQPPNKPVAPERCGGRGECVLVVDDESMIRRLLSALLSDAGYVVETAADGIDAIERVREDVNRYAVVLLDQSMPRLAGRAALRAIRALSPSMKVICFSGFPSALEGADAVLEKPVAAEVLLDTLRAVIDERVGFRRSDS